MKKQHDSFIEDTPIEEEDDDILDRENFVTHLSNALIGWRQSEDSKSIVIALCGKWGSGKSSIINLVTKNINQKKNGNKSTKWDLVKHFFNEIARKWKNNNGNKPIIVRFNPWEFSKTDGLAKHFFNEIARGLEINSDSGKDKKAAKKLRLYAKLFELLTSPITSLTNWLPISPIFLGSGLVGISYIPSDIPSDLHEKILLYVGVFFVVVGVIKEILIALANYRKEKGEFFSKSASAIKDEIIKHLKNRKRKILVVIDDIDRLNQSEIKQIFQLIKINADFPNTIYLLSFDREIVEKNLDDVQRGISGKDYMDKIVQVCFDVPVVDYSKVWEYFEKELERVLNKLPEGTAKEYFSGNDYSRFRKTLIDPEMKGFIKNIRDAKRFINSLEFSLLQMHLKGYMEVNVIDFIAIEAIRMFAPSFYSFMKQEKDLFTSILNDEEEKTRIERVQKAIDEVQPKEVKDSVFRLIKELFPQMDSNHTTNSENRRSLERRKELRVCELEFFDHYFTMLLCGGEYGLSQFEIRDILHSANSAESLEEMLMKYIEHKRMEYMIGKMEYVITRIGDFANDKEMVPLSNIKNIVKALFNVSDNLSGRTIEICCKFLRRENDDDKVLEILKEIIPHSKGLYWPVSLIYIASDKNSMLPEGLIIPENKIEEMQKMCVTHIQSFDVDDLLKNKHLGFIMNRWYEWGSKKTLEKFIEEIQKNDEQLLEFIDKFISIGEQFREGLLKFFGDMDEMEKRLKNIKKEKPALYEKYKEAIDLYLNPPD